MNFGQLQTAVYQVCGYPTPVQPIVVQRVKNWINEAHRHCLRLPGLVELRQRSGIPFTSVAGQAVYSFHAAFERIDAVVERTTHRRLRSISRDTFRSIDPAETSNGTPTCYAPEGWQCRFALPTGPPRDLEPPGLPTVADTGVGTYPAIKRYYRIGLWVTDAAGEILRQTRIDSQPSISIIPSGTGAAVRVTRPALTAGQGESVWIVEASLDNVTYYGIGILPIVYTTFDDTILPEAYESGPYLNAASAPIYAASSSALDVTQVVRMQTIHPNGDLEPPVQVTMTGSARVLLGGGSDLVSLTLSSTCAGDVSFYDQGTGGHKIARIPSGQTSAQYWCVRLWPTPSGPVTYYVDGQIEIPDLVYETDIPMLPPSYHDLLAAFARVREYERTGDSRLAIAAAELERGVAQLRAFVNFPDDWKPVAGSMESVNRASNLGGFFPADWNWP